MVTAIILAAGQATRMGQPKQLLTLGGKPMIWQVAATACQANFAKVFVITGAYDAEVKPVLVDLDVQIIYNENWAQGQATSVKKAVQSVVDETGAVAFLLADQPLVDVALLNHLIETYDETGASIIIPRYKNRHGNPVLFDLATWRLALLQLSGDEGARQIIRNNQAAIHYYEVLDEQMFFDVDRRADYESMTAIWSVVKK